MGLANHSHWGLWIFRLCSKQCPACCSCTAALVMSRAAGSPTTCTDLILSPHVRAACCRCLGPKVPVWGFVPACLYIKGGRQADLCHPGCLSYPGLVLWFMASVYHPLKALHIIGLVDNSHRKLYKCCFNFLLLYLASSTTYFLTAKLNLMHIKDCTWIWKPRVLLLHEILLLRVHLESGKGIITVRYKRNLHRTLPPRVSHR